ncbi:MAG: hypothetical protein WCW40_07230 [Bacteroidota bacterium]
MTTILTTLYMVITFGFTVETTSLTVESTTPESICGDPTGQLIPPPTN